MWFASLILYPEKRPTYITQPNSTFRRLPALHHHIFSLVYMLSRPLVYALFLSAFLFLFSPQAMFGLASFFTRQSSQVHDLTCALTLLYYHRKQIPGPRCALLKPASILFSHLIHSCGRGGEADHGLEGAFHDLFCSLQSTGDMDRSSLSRMYRAGAPRGLRIEKRIHTPSVLNQNPDPRMAYMCNSIGRDCRFVRGLFGFCRHSSYARERCRFEGRVRTSVQRTSKVGSENRQGDGPKTQCRLTGFHDAKWLGPQAPWCTQYCVCRPG